MVLFPTYADVAVTVMRVIVGAMFLLHASMKLKDLKGTMGFVKGTAFPGGAVFAVLFILLETLGGIAFLIGFLTQVAAVFFVLEMIATSIFQRTKLQKKLIGGYEVDVLFLVLALAIALLGPGPWSVDRILRLA